jgi:hypothetical protein
MSFGDLQASLNWADCRIRSFDTFSLRNIKVFPFTRRICTSRILDIRRLYVYETILLIHKVGLGLIKHNLVLETNSQMHSYGTRRRDDFRTIQARNNYGVHLYSVQWSTYVHSRTKEEVVKKR